MSEQLHALTGESDRFVRLGWFVYDDRMKDPYDIANETIPTEENASGLNSSQSSDVMALLANRNESNIC